MHIIEKEWDDSHVSLVIEVERHHIEKHIQWLVNHTRHEEDQSNGFAILSNIQCRQSTNEYHLEADEPKNLVLLVAKSSAYDPN